MKTGHYENCARCEQEPVVMNRVIYLYDPKRASVRRKEKNSAVFWNVLFTGLCLSVLIIVFLH